MTVEPYLNLLGAFAGALIGTAVAGILARPRAAPGEEIAAFADSEARRLEPPPLPKDPTRCQGKPGCTNPPVTQRHFKGGGSQRLCAPCAADPSLVPPEHRLPGTPGALPP